MTASGVVSPRRASEAERPIPVRIDVLGVPVDPLRMSEAVDRARGFVRDGAPRQLVAINAAKVVRAGRDPAFRDILWSSDLAFVDGQPVRFAARLLGRHVPELISGHLFMQALVARAADEGLSIFLLGAKPEVVERAVETLRDRHPALRVAGWRDGYWDPSEEEEVVRQVREAAPDMLFLALGTPRKEEWIRAYKEALGVPVCLGVGGSFNVIAGFQKVEPVWIRRLGLAWLYRLAQEPRRLWRRYAATMPLFFAMLIKGLFSRAAGRTGSRPQGRG